MNKKPFTPKEHSCWPGHYIIPGMMRYTVTPEGEVFDTVAEKYLKKTVNKTTRRYVVSFPVAMQSIQGSKRAKAHHNHILTCTAFYGHPGPEQRKVDFLDGNELNTHYKNLRWHDRVVPKHRNLAA